MDDEQYRNDEELEQDDNPSSNQGSQGPNLNQARRALQNRSLNRPSPFRLPGLSKLGGRGSGGVGTALRAGSTAVRAVAFFATPPGIVVLILIILFTIIVLFFLFFDLSNGVTVTLTKSGPEKVENCETGSSTSDDNSDAQNCLIEYTLNASYTGNPSRIVVTDKLDANVEFISAEPAGKYEYNASTHTVTWTFGSGGTNTGTGSANLGENVPPNNETCGGKYNLSSNTADGKNYGDPECTLADSPRVNYEFQGKSWENVPQSLIDLLEQLDPQNVGYWIGIISCEAPGFDPNNVTFFVGSTPTPDSGGAWGLFQMGRATAGPYQEGDGLNGPYDRGDVNWQNQVNNAVRYNKERLNGNWRYWECASIVWGLW